MIKVSPTVVYAVLMRGTHECGRTLDQRHLGTVGGGTAGAGDATAPAPDDEVVVVAPRSPART